MPTIVSCGVLLAFAPVIFWAVRWWTLQLIGPTQDAR